MNRVAISIYILLLALLVTGVAQAQPMMKKLPEFQTMVASKYAFNDTVELLKGAIEAQNLMVITEIDAQKMLRMIGFQTKGMKQLFFFHPRFMKSIIESNGQASIEPPLKIAVMETPDGKANVKFIKPSYLFGRYQGLEKLGEELDDLLLKIVGVVQK